MMNSVRLNDIEIHHKKIDMSAGLGCSPVQTSAIRDKSLYELSTVISELIENKKRVKRD